MQYAEEYRNKCVSPDEAVSVIRSGDIVEYGYFNGKPVVCDQALARRAPELKDVVIFTAVTVPPLPEVCNHPASFIYTDWHWSKLTRLIHEHIGTVYYCPTQYHRSPDYYRDLSREEDLSYRSVHYDRPEKKGQVCQIAILQVAPMDRYGFFNYGPQTSETSAKVELSDTVIVEVNTNMPVCLGGVEESIHLSRVDHIVEAPADQQLYDAPRPEPADTDRMIAANIMPFIHNGCCIQLGIGSLPTAVGSMIAASDLRDLGGHTEMFTEAFVDMIESGRMNGSRKTIDRHRCTHTFALGSRRVYDFMHQNPALAACPVNYTNDPRVIACLDNMISINNAVQVDLFSQVNAESYRGSQISGNGGMWDFVLGAAWSDGGKSFISLSSTHTDADGTVHSRIVPALTDGSICTIPRQMVDYIVTEYGAARLVGCSTWMRAEKLINIAHPDFRDDLIQQADQLKIWRNRNRLTA